MGKVFELETYRNERQFVRQYLENYELVTEMIEEIYVSSKPTKKEVDREMQLAYMKMLTKKANKT